MLVEIKTNKEQKKQKINKKNREKKVKKNNLVDSKQNYRDITQHILRISESRKN